MDYFQFRANALVANENGAKMSEREQEKDVKK